MKWNKRYIALNYSMNKNNIIVNSWNEWDPLKHVIVGRADGTCIPAPEPALDAKVPEDSDMPVSYTHLTLPTIYSV